MARKYLVNLDLGGNMLLNPVLNPLATAPANAAPYYIYTSTANGDKGTMYTNIGTYASPSWLAIGAVTSVNGKTGAVVLTQDDVGDGTTYVRTHNDLTDALVTLINGALQKSGGTMSGAIAMGSNKITGLGTPSDNADAATKKYVDDAISGLPEPMVFKGSLGDGGTISTLPAASASNEGYVYKVITAGTYASQAAKVGDTFISDGSTWVLIPSGDEPSGTVTSITISATSPIAVNDSSAITTSGTRTISHANSGVTAGTYTKVTVNATGHVTSGASLAAGDIPDISGSYKTVQSAVSDPTAQSGATALEFISNISQNTNGVISPTKKKVTADATPTENSNNLVTSGGVYAAIQEITGGSVHKKTLTNPALTSSGGAWTWSIAAGDAIGSADIVVTLYKVSTGEVVFADVVVNQSSGAVTITINDTASASTLAAGTYKAVLVG